MKSYATVLNVTLFGAMIITAGMCVNVQKKAMDDVKAYQEAIDTLARKNMEFGRVFKEAGEACREADKKRCPSCVYFEMYLLKEKR